jgi:hypothetical protein
MFFFPILLRLSLLGILFIYCRGKSAVIKLIVVEHCQGVRSRVFSYDIRYSMFCIEKCFEKKLYVLIRCCRGPTSSLLSRVRLLLGSYNAKLNSAIDV